ncbi:uncharacterized protein LOC114323899 [Camellia sinensis]|uniref:uncharacterized protein LOC114323899 n=1 Tax=Camellia sinensis TaxID=4442 RepID=UPI0010369885|nr:uncharacterized protein LOC114323899 [Camellia sinensis]
MPPLSDVHAPKRRATDVPSSSRARARDIPSSSGADTSRGGAGWMSSTCQYTGWPDLPTGLTGWKCETPYQIPLKPPRPGHRYVSEPDLPPPPREYMDGLLGVVASLEGMVLWRETMLFVAGVSVPPLQVGPSKPSREAGRGGSTRSRGRHRAPIRDDEESTHPQSETSAGREEDSGSGSESGGDAGEDSEDGSSDSNGGGGSCGAEAVQAKRMKRASRS